MCVQPYGDTGNPREEKLFSLIPPLLYIFSIFCQLLFYFPYSVPISFFRLAGILGLVSIALVYIVFSRPSGLNGLAKTVYSSGVLLLTIYTIVIPFTPADQNFIKDYPQMILWIVSFLWAIAFFHNRPEYSIRFIRLFPKLLILNTALLIIFFRYSIKISVNSGDFDVITTAFFIVFLLPGCLLTSPGLKKNIAITVIFIICLMSLKRSLMLMVLGSIAVMYLFNSKSSPLRKILMIIIAAAGLMLAAHTSYGEKIIYRFNEIQNDKGSGRLDIYEDVINDMSFNSGKEWLAGHGPRAVQHFFHQFYGSRFRSAHNDFLEMLYDFGLPALVCYTVLHLLLLAYCVKLRRRKSEYFVPFCSAWIFFIVTSLTSHIIIMPGYPVYIMTVLGLIIALDNRNYSIEQYEKAIIQTPRTEKTDKIR